MKDKQIKFEQATPEQATPGPVFATPVTSSGKQATPGQATSEHIEDIKNLKNRVRILEEQIALILEKMVKL